MGYIHIPNLAEGADWRVELLQARDEGRDLSSVQEAFDKLSGLSEREQLKQAALLMDAVQSLPLRADYPYHEPGDHSSILQARPKKTVPDADYDRQTIYNKIYGAWLGRCAGCLLGKPMEGWKQARIVGFLRAIGNDPVAGYCSSDQSAEIREAFQIDDTATPHGTLVPFINNVSHMVIDDDTNYSIFSVLLLELYGRDFSPYQLLELWLNKFPLCYLWTAERVAYRNAIQCIEPPNSAIHRNPYREWIGAQIRADVYGYLSPGRPEEAARMAFADAGVSHVKNGVYGAMWVAAMLAHAATDDHPERAIIAGLQQIPEKSRLAEGLSSVLDWRRQGRSGQQALEEIHSRYDESNSHDWCHAISNSMIVTTALLWGEKDMDKTFHYALTAGFDTDCNAATAGSVLGMMLGADALPPKWTAPLHNKIQSGIAGTTHFNISDLAQRCVALLP